MSHGGEEENKDDAGLSHGHTIHMAQAVRAMDIHTYTSGLVVDGVLFASWLLHVFVWCAVFEIVFELRALKRVDNFGERWLSEMSTSS